MLDLLKFALAHGMEGRINGSTIIVWDNMGFIQTKSLNDLKKWLGY